MKISQHNGGSHNHKEHRPSQAGRKKEKKSSPGRAEKRENPKAFAVYRATRAAKTGQRLADKKESKLHVPLVNRTPDIDAPPLIVAIVGPPKVGKSTLVRSLVKRFSHQSISKVLGPITVVSGKARRITLIECPNDLGVMIDVAKIADLVVLLIDASFGFEMETFEFLNIASTHGMPKVIGALTHLDTFTSVEALRKAKRDLKHRWWSEIQAGVKLFSLSGLIGNGHPSALSSYPQYFQRDVLNLSRYIAVAKPRPIIWKNSNSYLLIDRVEDLTPPDIQKNAPHSDKKVALYGWTRGCALRPPCSDGNPLVAHIPGVGDLSLNSITRLDDPCPTPERMKSALKSTNINEKEKKRTTLRDLERRLYAPMSDIAGILYDKDAVYLDIPDSKSSCIEQNDDGITILDELQGTSFEPLDSKLSQSGISLFGKLAHVEGNNRKGDRNSGSPEVQANDDYDQDNDEDELSSGYEEDNYNSGCESEEDEMYQFYQIEKHDTEAALAVEENEEIDLFTKFEDDDQLELADEDNPEFLDRKWKEILAAKSEKSIYTPPVQSAVYENAVSMTNGMSARSKLLLSDDEEEEFFKVEAWPSQQINDIETFPNEFDATLPTSLDLLKKTRFLTGLHDNEDDSEDLASIVMDKKKGHNNMDSDSDDSEEVNVGEEDEVARKKRIIKKRFDIEYDASKSSASSFYDPKPKEDDDLYAAAKRAMATQEILNRSAFEGEDIETQDSIRGFLPGTYVRIIINNAPSELIEYFDPAFPIIVGVVPIISGGLKFGIIHARVKKHRWHETILKSGEPLIWSAGWRRFQSIPLFYTNDRGSRIDGGVSRRRMIKYTPRHAHCMAAFYGPLLPNNTGIIACRSVKATCSSWRVSLTGVSIESTASTSSPSGDMQKSEIMKKLKLTGTPLAIAKHTALIKDMFNSPLEVAKFEGASIRTVSGIRGTIKKAVNEGPPGTFRATFEDRLLMSDIVFLRAWTPVSPKTYYNPITSLLLKNKSDWIGMRLNWEIRRALDAPKPASQNPSSVYDTQAAIEDRTQFRRFNPLHIPKQLEEALPFASKPKLEKPTSVVNKKKPLTKGLAVFRDENERRVASLLQELGTIKRFKEKKRKTVQDKKRHEYQAKKSRLKTT